MKESRRNCEAQMPGAGLPMGMSVTIHLLIRVLPLTTLMRCDMPPITHGGPSVEAHVASKKARPPNHLRLANEFAASPGVRKVPGLVRNRTRNPNRTRPSSRKVYAPDSSYPTAPSITVVPHWMLRLERPRQVHGAMGTTHEGAKREGCR